VLAGNKKAEFPPGQLDFFYFWVLGSGFWVLGSGFWVLERSLIQNSKFKT
jgi:hypothetical protein